MVRTRIAPSPTGQPHIGTIYQAIFDFVLAHKYNGQFIVRIEDTDRVRLVEGAEDAALDALEWFALHPDESPRNPGKVGPYRQSERLDLYNKYINILINKPLPSDIISQDQIDLNNQEQYCAYYCFCTKERLEALREQQQKEKKTPRYDKHCLKILRKEALEKINNQPYVVRLNIPSNVPIVFNDWLVGKVEVIGKDIDDQVLLKADGFPTYHFAVVVDDELMKITHVIRGREWLPSTPKHIVLYKYFGWTRPVYIHMPVILNMDGKGKLSKRHGHAAANYYKDEGFLPEAITNYLINIVWNHPEGKEIFSLNEFKEKLHINQIEGGNRIYANADYETRGIISLTEHEEKFITSQGPRFDLAKLRWVNQQYIQTKSNIELKKLILDFYPKAKQLDSRTLDALIPLVNTRMETLKDFEISTKIFFDAVDYSLSNTEKGLAQKLHKELVSISEWNHDMIFSTMKKIMTEEKIRMPLLYKILTGAERGLPLPETIEILGKDKTLSLLGEISK